MFELLLVDSLSHNGLQPLDMMQDQIVSGYMIIYTVLIVTNDYVLLRIFMVGDAGVVMCSHAALTSHSVLRAGL